MADVADEHAQLAKQLDLARADEDQIRKGLRDAQRLVVRGLMSEEDYVQRKVEVDAELHEAAQRVADLTAQIDAINPEADVFERLARALGRMSTETRVEVRPVDVAVPFDVPDPADWPTEEVVVEAMPAEEWNQLLRKIIRKVAVGPRTIEIQPWTGEPTVYVRALVTPRRKRTDAQVRDPRTGRFVRRAS
jgi:hypothetical protein